MSDLPPDRPLFAHQPSPSPASPSPSSGSSDAFPHGISSPTEPTEPTGPSGPSEPVGPSKGDVAKDTAAAMFGEMKAAVGGASKREPYPWLAVAAAIAAVVWLLWPEDDKLGAENLKLWTVFVVASVALVFAPMVRKVLRLPDERAWQFCVAGAAGLGFAWVAFLLPTINSNQAFFGTIGVAAAGLAAWTAPGRPQ